MAPRARCLLLLLFAAGLVGCDHATKFAAESALRHDGPLSLVPGVLDLRYTQNHSMAFSLLEGSELPGKRILIVALSTLAIGALTVVWWRRRARATRLEQWGFALLLAGALGNVIDRVLRGYVVDFIHLRYWPVFNVADVLVAVGAGLLLLGAIRAKREPPARKELPPPLGPPPFPPSNAFYDLNDERQPSGAR